MPIRSASFVKGIVGTDEVLNDDYPQIAFIIAPTQAIEPDQYPDQPKS